MEINDIMNALPHRYPMLLLDRIVDTQENRASGIKQLSNNEWYFQGHFPHDPKMPAGLLLESMGQVGAAAILARPENQGKYLFLAGLDNVEVHQLPAPGRSLRMDAELLRFRGDSGRTQVICYDAETVIAKADYTFVLTLKAAAEAAI